MTRSDKDMEKLISRHLDGLLNEDEQLDFDREMIRNPEARRMLEASQEIERLAADALRDSFDQEPVAVDFDALPPQSTVQTRRPRSWAWTLVPGSIAAALLAVILAQLPLAPPTETQTPIADGSQATAIPLEVETPRVGGQGSDAPMHRVSRNALTKPRIKRATGRDVFGVIGDDGNIYWIEVDRTRTLIQRPTGPQPF